MNAIEIRDVSKTFHIHHERRTTLAERLLSFFRYGEVDEVRAVDQVTLDVPAGEFVGVIGSNGSGKSTLLKLMAGLLVPDAGHVRVNGTLVPLLELGLGFHQELTVRENVLLYGLVLGYPHAELDRRIADVIAFAGLEAFRDAKLKSLSSGMLVRLAFATAIRADAEILLLDEVLAVGDANFQRKCIDVFKGLKRERRTIVLVSHDINAVQRFCDKVFWLDKGRLVMSGDSTDVVQMYLTVMETAGLEAVASIEGMEATEHRWGDGRVRLSSARLESEDGEPLTRVTSGQRIVVRVEGSVRGHCAEPVVGLIIWRGGEVVYSTNTAMWNVPVGSLDPGDRCAVDFSFVVALREGQYTVTVAAADRDGTVYDWINHLITFLVVGSRCGEGVADLRADIQCEVTKAMPAGAVGAGPRG